MLFIYVQSDHSLKESQNHPNTLTQTCELNAIVLLVTKITILYCAFYRVIIWPKIAFIVISLPSLWSMAVTP